MAREATEQISHALDQRVVLRMDENLGDQILAGILDQAFTCVQIVRDISVAVDCEKCVHWLFAFLVGLHVGLLHVLHREVF